jgi:hypothetical protein
LYVGFGASPVYDVPELAGIPEGEEAGYFDLMLLARFPRIPFPDLKRD